MYIANVADTAIFVWTETHIFVAIFLLFSFPFEFHSMLELEARTITLSHFLQSVFLILILTRMKKKRILGIPRMCSGKAFSKLFRVIFYQPSSSSNANVQCLYSVYHTLLHFKMSQTVESNVFYPSIYFQFFGIFFSVGFAFFLSHLLFVTVCASVFVFFSHIVVFGVFFFSFIYFFYRSLPFSVNEQIEIGIYLRTKLLVISTCEHLLKLIKWFSFEFVVFVCLVCALFSSFTEQEAIQQSTHNIHDGKLWKSHTNRV